MMKETPKTGKGLTQNIMEDDFNLAEGMCRGKNKPKVTRCQEESAKVTQIDEDLSCKWQNWKKIIYSVGPFKKQIGKRLASVRDRCHVWVEEGTRVLG